MSNRKRKLPDDRSKEILSAAVRMARIHGYNHVDRPQIADAAGCSPNLISHYYGTIAKLRRAIVGEAIRTGDLVIIAQGLVAKDPRVNNLSTELKERAMAHVLGVSNAGG